MRSELTDGNALLADVSLSMLLIHVVELCTLFFSEKVWLRGELADGNALLVDVSLSMLLIHAVELCKFFFTEASCLGRLGAVFK